MKKILAGVMLVAAVGCVSSSYNVSMETEPVRVVRAIGPKAMRDAIVAGAAKRDWIIRSEKPGCVTLDLDVRGGKHRVTVDVNYTGDEFSVRYVDSVNLDYKPGSGAIRGKYVQWVRNLKQEIRLEASRVR